MNDDTIAHEGLCGRKALNKAGKNITVSRILVNLFLIIVTLVVLVPVYMTVVGSLKTDSTIAESPFSLTGLTLANFKMVFSNQSGNVLKMYFNTIVITGSAVVLIIIIEAMAGYYLARKKSKIAVLLSLIFVSGLMIPDEVIIIPLVTMYVKLNLIGTIHGLFLFFVGARGVIAIFLYQKFIGTIPYELEESAIVDGAGQLRIIWQIIFPLLKPCTATVAIFVGLGVWNDFLMPVFLLRDSDAKTITVGIYSALGETIQNWALAFAWVVVAAVPVALLFLLFQRFFIDGMTAGAIKG